jgi:hypothetical protein
VAFFLAVTLLAPLVEELTYRGLGFSLLQPYGVALAVVVTGALFGLTHGLLIGLPVLVFFGIVVGWLRAKTDSVYPGMVLHAAFNAIALSVSVSGAGSRYVSSSSESSSSASSKTSSRLVANSSGVTVSMKRRNSSGSRSARLDAVTRLT